MAKMIQHPDSTLITGLEANKFTKFFPGVVGNTPKGMASHHIEAIFSVPDHFVITAHVTVYFQIKSVKHLLLKMAIVQ